MTELTLLGKDTKEALKANYDFIGLDEPTEEDMNSLTVLISTFLAEIMETCSHSHKARAASELAQLIEDNDINATCNNIAEYRNL